jgi:UDP-N-acetylmuramoyl-L-alanyl-D-glutamate--2,6-diaminopimelate ligase
MIRANRGGLLTYGIDTAADVRARAVTHAREGIRFVSQSSDGEVPVHLRHLGAYSVYNALAALAAGTSLGIPLDTIAAGLAAAPPVRGRFELIEVGQDFVVAIDYAHKPDALARLLQSARQLDPRRLITVFGCGGDRDRGKRPVMGRIAIELSDYVIVTSDNPRSEEPAAIIDEILAGLVPLDPSAARHRVEVDRAAAIRSAVAMAESGDMVLIAGKGHETYQLVGGRRLDFDDAAHARAALTARQRRPG